MRVVWRVGGSVGVSKICLSVVLGRSERGLGIRGGSARVGGMGVSMSNFTTREAKRFRKEDDSFDKVCRARLNRKNGRKVCG